MIKMPHSASHDFLIALNAILTKKRRNTHRYPRPVYSKPVLIPLFFIKQKNVEDKNSMYCATNTIHCSFKISPYRLLQEGYFSNMFKRNQIKCIGNEV